MVSVMGTVAAISRKHELIGARASVSVSHRPVAKIVLEDGALQRDGRALAGLVEDKFTVSIPRPSATVSVTMSVGSGGGS
jgi:hypothetical protein